MFVTPNKQQRYKIYNVHSSVIDVRGGGGDNSKNKKKSVATARTPPQQLKKGLFHWFKPTFTKRERVLATWLLIWDGIALVDAIRFTFQAKQNLDGYLLGDWCQHTVAMTRMLANCQLAFIATTALVAFIGQERTLKQMFIINIFATLGAFRAIAAGVAEGTIKAPWKTGYAAVMSAPPLLLLSYFAFLY